MVHDVTGRFEPGPPVSVVTGEFLDRAEERAFRRWTWRDAALQARSGLIVALLAFIAFIPTDAALFGLSATFQALLASRAALCVLAGFALAVTWRPRLGHVRLDGMVLATVAGAFGTTALIAAVYPVDYHIRALVVVLVVGTYLYFYYCRLIRVAAVALLGSIGCAVAVHAAHGPLDARMLETAAVFVLANAICFGAARRLNRLRRNEFASQRAQRRLNAELGSEVTDRRRAEVALRDRERQYREVVEGANSIILRWDTEGRITFLNRYGLDFFGWRANELIGRPVIGTIVPETESDGGRDLTQLMQEIQAHPERFAHNENENMRRNGERVWLAWSNRPVHDESGVLTGILSVAYDITGRKAAETALQRSEKSFRTLFDAAPVPLVLAHRESGDVLLANHAANELFACRRLDRLPHREALGELVADAEVPDSQSGSGEEWGDSEWSDGSGRRSGEVLEVVDANGLTHHVLPTVDVMTYHGEPALLVSLADVTDQKRMEDELRRLATTDPLTGAPNRRSFFDTASRELARSRRYSRPMSVLMLDVDHFKAINDTLGHEAGDQALRRLVRICREQLRENDIVARLGGEEFAILLPETPPETARKVAERIRARVADSVLADRRVTVSLGLAGLEPRDTDIDALLRRADAALFRAKQSGRNRVTADGAAAEADER